MKRLLCAVLALAMLGVMFAASADPMLTHRGNIAWLGERNYLYLRDARGTVKQLPSAIANLVGMDDESIYCTTASGRLYAVRLDGSASSIVSTDPSEAELFSYRIAPPYDLTDGVLALLDENGGRELITDNVVMAAAGENAVYYVTAEDTRFYLHACPVGGGQLGAFVETEVNEPESMAVSLNALALLDVNGNILLENLQTGEIMNQTSISDAVKVVAYVDDLLFQYQVTPSGTYETLRVDNIPFTGRNLPVTAPAAAETEPETDTGFTPEMPAGTETQTADTAADTAPAEEVYVTPTPDPADKTIYLGDRGSRVRRMQQRLFDLGYPVGKVDGVYGDETAYAVNLFQSATGASEHSYMTDKTQNVLFGNSAPAYDPYMPLVKGDRGVRVRQMQAALNSLGYSAGNIDGIYGDNTVIAVAAYQEHIGEAPTEGAEPGVVASRYLLINLYNEAGGKPVVTNEPEEKQTPTADEDNGYTENDSTVTPAPEGEDGASGEEDPEPTRTKRPIKKSTATPSPAPSANPEGGEQSQGSQGGEQGQGSQGGEQGQGGQSSNSSIASPTYLS